MTKQFEWAQSKIGMTLLLLAFIVFIFLLRRNVLIWAPRISWPAEMRSWLHRPRPMCKCHTHDNLVIVWLADPAHNLQLEVQCFRCYLYIGARTGSKPPLAEAILSVLCCSAFAALTELRSTYSQQSSFCVTLHHKCISLNYVWHSTYHLARVWSAT